jgi:serine protease Do
MSRFGRLAALALAVLASGTTACDGGTTAAAQSRTPPIEFRQQLGEVPATLDTATAAGLSGAFRSAANQALPAVVQVRVIARREGAAPRGGLIPFGGGDAPRRSEGTGSGFIIDGDGHILTNHHVVESAERVEVVLTDGRDYIAEVIGIDPSTDVAVIRIRKRNGEALPVAEIGDSDEVRVGDWVLALGNPLGLEFTVTAGIVSAKGRSINIIRTEDNTQLESFIQTDAAINPGNSGGPMVDLLGRVVGINTAISSQTGFFAGAGFAIPINLAHKVAGDLIRYGAVHRPRLGIGINDVRAPDAEVFRLASVAGSYISSISPNEPAARAGLQLGDVIVAIEGVPIRTSSDLQAQVARFHPGDRIRVNYVRYGEMLEATVQLGEFEVRRDPALASDRPTSGARLLGFRVSEVPQEIAQRPAWRNDWRVVVSEIENYGPLQGRVAPGSVLIRMNGRDIASVRDVERLGAGLREGDVVSLMLIDPRAGDPQPQLINYRAR